MRLSPPPCPSINRRESFGATDQLSRRDSYLYSSRQVSNSLPPLPLFSFTKTHTRTYEYVSARIESSVKASFVSLSLILFVLLKVLPPLSPYCTCFRTDFFVTYLVYVNPSVFVFFFPSHPTPSFVHPRPFKTDTRNRRSTKTFGLGTGSVVTVEFESGLCVLFS